MNPIYLTTKKIKAKVTILTYLSILFCFYANSGWAQQLTNAEYFFDTDPGIGNGTSINITPADTLDFTANLSTAGLGGGFHQVFIRFQNDSADWSLYEGRGIYVKPKLVNAEYFLDTDPGIGNGTAISITSSDTLDFIAGLPVTGLSPGHHQLFIRVQNDLSVWSLYEERGIYVKPKLTNAEYFFDTDPGIGNGTSFSIPAADTLNFTANISIAGLSAGFHKIFIRVQNEISEWSLYEQRGIFIKPKLIDAEYFFDTDPGIGNATPISISPADTVDFISQISTAGVDTGAHYLYIRFRNDEGVWSHAERDSLYIFNCSTPSIYSSLTGTNDTCNGGNDGAADLTVSGSLPPFTFIWSPGSDTTEDISGLVAGTYSVIITDSVGCTANDTIIITQPPLIITYDTTAICANDSVFLQGDWQDTIGTYYDTLVSTTNGCDSIIATTLVINPTFSITDSAVTLCNGDSISIYGTFRSITGTFYDSLTTVSGCDSVHSTTLTVLNPVINTFTTDTICDNDSIFLQGAFQNTPGTYFDTLISAGGCDSAISTTLTVNATYNITDSAVTICNDDSISIYGTFRNVTGTYYNSLTTINGCDSVHSTALTANPTYSTSTPDTTICDGDSVMLFGIFRTIDGTYYDSLSSNNSCDSIVSTTLIVNSNPIVSLGADTAICNGCVITIDAGAGFASYNWSTGENTPTIIIDTSGTFYVQVTDANDCANSDTIVINILTGIDQSGNLLAGRQVSDQRSIIIYPNPNTGKFTLEIYVDPNEATEFELSIFNILGQSVYTETLYDIKGIYKKEIDLRGNRSSEPRTSSEGGAGLYNLQLVNETVIINRKIILEK